MLSFIVEFQHDSSVLELLEVRRILEPAACARAATEITKDALVELEKILELVTVHSPVIELVGRGRAISRSYRVRLRQLGARLAHRQPVGLDQRARVTRHHPGGLGGEDPLRAPGDIRGDPLRRRATSEHVVHDPYRRGRGLASPRARYQVAFNG